MKKRNNHGRIRDIFRLEGFYPAVLRSRATVWTDGLRNEPERGTEGNSGEQIKPNKFCV